MLSTLIYSDSLEFIIINVFLNIGFPISMRMHFKDRSTHSNEICKHDILKCTMRKSKCTSVSVMKLL